MGNWSRAALAAVLTVAAVVGPGGTQYWSGYGTGPESADPFPIKVPQDDPDLMAARAASLISIQLFRDWYQQSRHIQGAEPLYKYVRPSFASAPTSIAGF